MGNRPEGFLEAEPLSVINLRDVIYTLYTLKAR
jgi:hypothetical protein